MSDQDLKQENAKLTARLTKAAEVFKAQKADIERLTAERDAKVAELSQNATRIAEVEKELKSKSEQDETFFAQVEEIEGLKKELADVKVVAENDKEVLTKENEKLTARLEKATEEFKTQKEVIERLTKKNQIAIDFITKVQKYCEQVVPGLQEE